VSTDELTGVQALERKHPGLPLAQGKVERREFEYVRHGTRSFILSRDVVTGQMLAPACGPTRTEADFLAHLQAVVATQPEATCWHVVCDQLNTHQSESLVRFVAELSGLKEDLDVKGERGILASMVTRAAFRETIPVIRWCSITLLILGGAGLVGKQIAHRIATDTSLSPRKIVIARSEYADENPRRLLADPLLRKVLFADLYDKIEDTYERSHLVSIIRKHKPDVIIDSINTATAISYQNVYIASSQAKQQVECLLAALQLGEIQHASDHMEGTNHALYELLLSQSLPELIRHVLLLNEVMVECSTRLYLKIGSTGTGGNFLQKPKA